MKTIVGSCTLTVLCALTWAGEVRLVDLSGAAVSAWQEPPTAGAVLEVLSPEDGQDSLSVTILLDGAATEVALFPESVRSPGFRVRVQEAGGSVRQTPAPPCRTYRGFLPGCTEGSVLARRAQDRLHMWIRSGADAEDAWVVEPAGADAPAGAHWVYRQGEVARTLALCGVADEEIGPIEPAGAPGPPGAMNDLPVRVAQIACDADYAFYEHHGGDVAAVVADIETIMAGVSAIYEMDARITFEITDLLVRTSPESDPYTAPGSAARLNLVKEAWAGNYPEIERDLVHLFTGAGLDGATVGKAFWVGACGYDNFALTHTTFSTRLDERVAVTAHEIGHNFRLGHCDGTPGCHIMCPTLGNCSGGIHSFGPASYPYLARQAGESCLGDGAVAVESLELPFSDDFSYGKGAGVYDLDPLRWVEADQATINYGRLEVKMGRGWDGYIRLGTARTRPISLHEAAMVRFRLSQNDIPSNWYLKVDYLASDFTWQALDMVRSDGVYSSAYAERTYLVPPDGRHDFFAVRFSGWGYYQNTSTKEWRIDDVAIVPFGQDLNGDGRVSLPDFAVLAGAWAAVEGDGHWTPAADLAADGVITVEDLAALLEYWMLGGE